MKRKYYIKSFFVLFIIFPLVTIASSLPPDTLNKKPKKNKRLKVIKLPIVMKTPETKFGVGAAMSFTFRTSISQPDSILRTSNIQTLGLYTTRGQTIAGLDGVIYFPSENYILRLHGSYSYFPDYFWGIGNNTPKNHMERYTYQQAYFFPQLLKRVHKNWYVGLTVEYQRLFKLVHQQNESLFETEHVRGQNTSTIPGIGGIITWDSRDNAFSSTKGCFFEVSATTFNSALLSNFTYNNFIIDARKYLKTWRGQTVAFQAYGNFNKGQVPYLSLAALGGGMIMRGYYSGRFRDNNLVAVQGEYRIPIVGRFGIVGFVAIGEVSHCLNQINFYNLKCAAGGGLRIALKKDERLNLRLDYGVARNSSGLYLLVSEAF